VSDRNVAERSLNVIEEENKNLIAQRDTARAELERMRQSGGDQAAALRAELEQAKKDLKNTEHKLTSRHEHVAKLAPQLDDAKKENEKLRARIAELEKSQGAEKGQSAKRVAGLEEALKDAKAEVATARSGRDAAEADANKLREQLKQSEKQVGKTDELQRKIEARDRELDVAKNQIADLKQELKVDEEERKKAAEELKAAKAAEQEAADHAAELEDEAEGLRKRAEEAEAKVSQSGGLKNEFESLKGKLAEREDDNKALQRQLDASRKELERLRTLEDEVEELERQHTESSAELTRVGGALANAETAAEQARNELNALRDKIEQANERRHEAEKQLAESRAKLESEHRVRDEQSWRIQLLEESLQRERQTVDSSAPAAALESLSAQLATEREKWERITGEKESEIEDLRAKLAEGELRENELASQLEGIELSKQDVMRAKALAGQRRAQIERMQTDVEGARRQAKDAEAYWKGEMDEFRGAVAEHLEAAERGDEGSDQRLQKLMEDMKVGLADKYAKLRRRNNKVEKDLRDTGDKLAAIERILARREEEEARLRKIN
jgi:chromosome segregation ATPase